MRLPSYQPGYAEAYVQLKGWKYRRTGDELVLQTCPLCGDSKGRFYFNDDKGVWDCKHGACGRRGNLYQLQRELGDLKERVRIEPQEPKGKPRRSLKDFEPFEQALLTDPDGLGYLEARGLTSETAKTWHLGLKTDGDGVKWLLMPYVVDGAIVDVKYRSLPPAPKRYTRLYGGDSILYGQHLLAGADQRTLYLVEGEIDCLSMWQHGFSPVLSTTAGAGTFKPEWFDAIDQFEPEKIIVIYDSDVAGQKGAKVLLDKFGKYNCVNLILPGAKDANEYFETHTAEEFEALVTDAKPPTIENVLAIGDVLDILEQQLFFSASAFDGVASQFPDLNAMIGGGYWNGQLVCLSGISGVGKTSFVLQELLGMAKQGLNSYLLCLEMPNVMMLRKIFEKEYGIPMLKLTLEHVQAHRAQLASLPFWMGDTTKDLNDIVTTIRRAVHRYDIKIMAFDNVNYFVRDPEHQTGEIAVVTKALKQLAIELNIPIILIAQPRKFDDDTRMMTQNDLKDSSALAQDSDTIILLWRKRLKTDPKAFGQNAGFVGNQSAYTLVRVDKARYSGGGEAYLHFDGARSTYRPVLPTELAGLKSA